MRLSSTRVRSERHRRLVDMCVTENEKQVRQEEKQLRLQCSQAELQALAGKISEFFWEVPEFQAVIADWKAKGWKREPSLALVDIIDKAATFRCPWHPEAQLELKQRVTKFVMNFSRENGIPSCKVELYKFHLDAWDPYAE